MLEINALIRILKRKGITDEDEILKEVEKLKIEMNELVKKIEGRHRSLPSFADRPTKIYLGPGDRQRT